MLIINHIVSCKEKYTCVWFFNKVYTVTHFYIIQNHCDFFINNMLIINIKSTSYILYIGMIKKKDNYKNNDNIKNI